MYATSSPGRLHILLLGQHLEKSDIKYIDLTAGGGNYKNDMADASDQVYVLNVYFDTIAHVRNLTKATLSALLKSSLGAKGKVLASRLRDFNSQSMCNPLSVESVKVLWNQSDTGIAFTQSVMKNSASLFRKEVFLINSISDILLYQPVRKHDLSRRAFFDYVSRHLEAGDRLYTLSENGVLLHCAWLGYPANARSIERHNVVEFSNDVCLLWGNYTHPQADHRKLVKLSLAQRIYDAAQIPGVAKVIVAIRTNETHLVENVGA